jgi:hypothetical protein
MAKLTGIFGVLALLCTVVDLIHGQHNGDAHRMWIHIPEFIFFFGLLCLLEVWTFKTIIKEVNVNRWLLVTCFSFFSCLLGLVLFGMSGGSFHGDGGPISLSFLLLCTIGAAALPLSLIAFVAVAIFNKRNGIPILDHK